MNKVLLSLALSCCIWQAHSQEGHQIRLSIKPYHGGKVYLGYYYGKEKALADSATLDAEGNGQFAGKDTLRSGVYFVVSPSKVILFELLIDRDQHFSVSADTTNLPRSVSFTGSPDNTIFQAYTLFANEKGSAIAQTQKELAAYHDNKRDNRGSKTDSIRLTAKMKQLDADIQQYRKNLVVKYPSSLLATLFYALREPIVPPKPAGNTDSQYAYHYYKAHYWDSIPFTDDRLLRTPIFEPRLDKYFQNLVPPVADSIEEEADWMLLNARPNKEMFQFLMVYFVQKYVNPVYMGQDAVFVHLYEKYINSGEAGFFTDKYRDYLNNRAYSLMANLIGEPAANLQMVDTADNPRPLYGVEAPFLVICFWDPTCSHCQETVPKVDSIYQAKWKREGVRIYGVMVDGGRKAWLQFIHDHNLKDWIHVYETKARQDSIEAAQQPGYKQLYDVYQTPILYLLDADKRIIAKKLDYQQLDEIIDLKLKKNIAKQPH